MKGGVVLVVLLVFPVLVFADSPSWPQWRGPNGNGTSNETGWDPLALKGGAKVLWNVSVGMGYSSVAIENNRLYTMGKAGPRYKFYCLDAGTGEVIWQTNYSSLPGYEPQATPCVDGDRVYGVGKDGTVLCLGTADGRILWKRNLVTDFKATASPLQGWAASSIVADDLLILNANSRQIAIDKTTGDLKWAIEDEIPGKSWGSYVTPVMLDFGGRRSVLFVGPRTINVVDSATGEKVWSYQHDDWAHPVADPVVSASQVFFQLSTSFFRLDITGNKPSISWSRDDFLTFLPGVVLVDGFLYGTGFSKDTWITTWGQLSMSNWDFSCIDSRTGEAKWSEKMQSVGVTAADGKLLMLEVGGMLHIAEASPSGYKELSSADVLDGANTFRVFATPPVLCGGRIYVRNYAGDLICIDVSK